VIHAPDHRRSIAELTDVELERVAEAWANRAEAAHSEGFPYVHALINEGRAAGSSLPHTHSQLVWLREPPPVPAAERDCSRLLDGSVVLERSNVVVLCPHASWAPYQMLVAPVRAEDDAFSSAKLGPALILAAEGIRRLRIAEPEAAVNVWLHDVAWWHLEVAPRFSILAGLELGAGIFVNTLAPEDAAERLRRSL
jgi:UDPglucose--hexose-1-phosphate uridylyltransferase